jgi:outer membrane protein assembly factor BamD
MIYLRNKLADYELAVARYYMKRGAFVGAANRARGVIETYDGAPATLDALAVMAQAYRKLGIDDMAVAIDSILAQNTPPDDARRAADKPWWRFGF